MVAEEVKALSDCISQANKIIDHHGDSDGLAVPTSSIGQMQSPMLLIMGYVASAQVISDQVESHYFVDAAFVPAKLQHHNSPLIQDQQSFPVEIMQTPMRHHHHQIFGAYRKGETEDGYSRKFGCGVKLLQSCRIDLMLQKLRNQFLLLNEDWEMEFEGIQFCCGFLLLRLGVGFKIVVEESPNNYAIGWPYCCSSRIPNLTNLRWKEMKENEVCKKRKTKVASKDNAYLQVLTIKENAQTELAKDSSTAEEPVTRKKHTQTITFNLELSGYNLQHTMSKPKQNCNTGSQAIQERP
ncbi:hypothetical protein KIW84_035179 [Lathyrus oleraceus]|uniref:Uncharacterized protein n=1 Tax=Pisum sativum TaxID=3888 RepID=A0A9D4Y1I0_PEA|nr:hypothetical protein KIW84_035179 [Pisum sativum]